MSTDARGGRTGDPPAEDFVDPYAPSDDELRRWALKDGEAPVEDFDLMVAELDRAPLLLELTTSPVRRFALRCLYLIVGDAVRSAYATTARPQLEALLRDSEPLADGDQAIAPG